MKTCPVCGAGAFDDAEVCFGCLHKYEKDELGCMACATGPGGSVAAPTAGAGAARPVANPCSGVPSPGFQTKGSPPAMRQSQPTPVQSPVALAQETPASRAQGAMRPLPLQREACVAEAVPLPAARIAQTPQAASLFDGSGWVVRFEFPGFAPAPPAQQGADVERAEPGTLGRNCTLLAANRPTSESRPCSMVVRFQPEAAGALEETACSKPSRGSHAREPTSESPSADGSGRP